MDPEDSSTPDTPDTPEPILLKLPDSFLEGIEEAVRAAYATPEEQAAKELRRLDAEFNGTANAVWFLMSRLMAGFSDTARAFVEETDEIYGHHGRSALAYALATVCRVYPVIEAYEEYEERVGGSPEKIMETIAKMPVVNMCDDDDHDHAEEIAESQKLYAQDMYSARLLAKKLVTLTAPGRELEFADAFRPADRGQVQDMAITTLLTRAANRYVGVRSGATDERLTEEVGARCEEAAVLFAQIAHNSGSAKT